MYTADTYAVENGVASIALMEAAGRAVAREIFKRARPCRTVVLCGSGNNGGDGFVVARLLAEKGWNVSVAYMGNPDSMSNDAAVNFKRWKGTVLPLEPESLERAELIVDAVLGAGLTGPIEGVVRKTLEAANEMDVPIVAVDVPTGVHGTTGRVFGMAPKADLTVTFFRPKPGHFIMPGRELRGELVVADIGIPEAVLDEITPMTFVNGPSLWLDQYPRNRRLDHKYSRGHLVVYGGGQMTGAARLAARGARRLGVGLLTLACPEQAVPIYAADDPGHILHPIRSSTDLAILLEDSRKNVSLIGPGAGVSTETKALVLTALRGPQITVLDADALSVFEDRVEELINAIEDTVLLTPHEGEFGRLFDIPGDKATRARKAALKSGAVILLKGADTVIAAPDGRVVINANAPADLATGGSGDVLAGFAAALIARGMKVFEAACAAAWIHGAVGDEIGTGLIAEDIPEYAPTVVKKLLSQ